MAASEAVVGFWNHTGLLTSWQACPKTEVYRERVDEDVLKDTVNRLTFLHIRLRQTQLWSEFAIIKRIVYKNGNQHRKQFYFHGLRRIVKNLNRLHEIGISKKVTDIRNTFPSLPKPGLITDVPPKYPSVRLIVNILGCLIGAAQIILQASSFCQETFQYSCSELVNGYFLTFHLTLVSSLSRVWVFLKDFLYAVVQCYDIIFPWLNLLQDMQKIENSEAKDLPKSLKIWLEPLGNEEFNKTSNSTSVTPAKTLTPGTLDKLFASTPRENLEDTSPRFSPSTANADSLTEPCDLGESFVPDDINGPSKVSSALIVDDNSNLKTNLFPENPVELHNQEHYPQVNSNDSTYPKKRKATEVLDSELSSSPTKKLATELKRFLIRGGLCRHSCTTIHIFGNKTWKHSIERKLRKKLAQGALKKKQRRQEASGDGLFTKKRQREISSRDGVITKKKRIATGGKKTHSRKKAKKKSRRDAGKIKKKRKEEKSRDSTEAKKTRNETSKEGEKSRKGKRKLRKANNDEIPAKKNRKEEISRNSTKKSKKLKERVKSTTKTTKKWRKKACKDEVTANKTKENSSKDELKSNKKRRENSCKDEAKRTKEKRKQNSSKDELKTNKKQKEISSKDEANTNKKRKENCSKYEAKTKKKRKESCSNDEIKTTKKLKENLRKDEAKTTKRPWKENLSKDEAKTKKKTRKQKCNKSETKSKKKRSKVKEKREGKDVKHETHSKATKRYFIMMRMKRRKKAKN